MRPAAADRLRPEAWTVGFRAWLEQGGRAVVGPGRLDLLQGIADTGSISASARRIGMSYRHAWILIQDMNEAAGAPLVEASVGGRRGGGALVTPLGKTVMALSRQAQDAMRDLAESLVPRLLDEAFVRPGVHLAAAISLQEAVGRLLTDFAVDRPGVPVRTIYGASNELAEHILAGAPIDVFLCAGSEPLDRLARSGALAAGARRTLARNRVAAVGNAALVETVRGPRDLIGDPVARVALADPASPLGRHSQQYLLQVGLYDAVLPRVVQVDNSRGVVAAIHSGQADVGLAYTSDLTTASACQILFRAEASSRDLPFYEGAITRRGERLGAASELLAFLASADARRRFRECGFVPAKSRD